MVLTLLGSCKNDSDDTYQNTLGLAINHYAELVEANYRDALADAESLQTALDNFTATPTAAGLENCKLKWLQARESYGQTEAFRFYGGPIDDADGPEGQLNAWPLDESYIDYVDGATNGGDPSSGINIINNPKEFPTIDSDFIASRNENGSETNVSSGYHAIEFLLWGQDVSIGAGGGERSHTDYVTDGSGTNSNQDRRATYLKAACTLLVQDLEYLVSEWTVNGNYRTSFTAAGQETISLEKILSGLGKLSKGELAGERMFVAYDLKSKEDEHSCFSDNTHRDVVTNAKGIQNVYLGTYTKTDGTTLKGAGIYDLVALKNQELADEIKSIMSGSVQSAGLIEAPFDQEFLAEPGRSRIKTTIDQLRTQGDKLAEAAALFGFSLDPSAI